MALGVLRHSRKLSLDCVDAAIDESETLGLVSPDAHFVDLCRLRLLDERATAATTRTRYRYRFRAILERRGNS